MPGPGLVAWPARPASVPPLVRDGGDDDGVERTECTGVNRKQAFIPPLASHESSRKFASNATGHADPLNLLWIADEFRRQAVTPIFTWEPSNRTLKNAH